jgi:nanoRNase/pAp phosphatase (c-di-AMP/oligoRNAs hydrolase)
MMDDLVSGYNTVTQADLRSLRDAVGDGPLLVMTHDNPDPDALAAGSALRALVTLAWKIPVQLYYCGLVARAENKAMLEILTPEWEPLNDLSDIYRIPIRAMVDTQPGVGNNSLPPDLTPQIVFDHHHPIQKGLEIVQFADIRTQMGATSSILFQYLETAGIDPDPSLSTAIFYGIQTDTLGLSREGSLADQEIYFKLLAKIDRQKLVQVVQAGLPRQYFQAFSDGLKATRVFGQAAVSFLGKLPRPDFVSEMADTLVRLEDVRAVLTMGYHGDSLFLSLRTRDAQKDAGSIIQGIVSPNGTAGGHGTVAGGQISIRDKSVHELAAEVQSKFLAAMGESENGEDLLT